MVSWPTTHNSWQHENQSTHTLHWSTEDKPTSIHFCSVLPVFSVIFCHLLWIDTGTNTFPLCIIILENECCGRNTATLFQITSRFQVVSLRYSIAKAVSICSPLCEGIQWPTKHRNGETNHHRDAEEPLSGSEISSLQSHCHCLPPPTSLLVWPFPMWTHANTLKEQKIKHGAANHRTAMHIQFTTWRVNETCSHVDWGYSRLVQHHQWVRVRWLQWST